MAETSDGANEAIERQLRIIEDTTWFSSRAQFAQAATWRLLHRGLGIPAAALAAIAGAAVLSESLGRVTAGLIALAAAALSAISTTLNAPSGTETAQAAGNLYLALYYDARVAREVDLSHQTHEEAREALETLMVRRNTINQETPIPSRFAMWLARRNIRRVRRREKEKAARQGHL